MDPWAAAAVDRSGESGSGSGAAFGAVVQSLLLHQQQQQQPPPSPGFMLPLTTTSLLPAAAVASAPPPWGVTPQQQQQEQAYQPYQQPSIAPGMSASDSAAAALFAQHAAAAAAAAAASAATAAAAAPGSTPSHPPQQPSFIYGPGNSGLPMYLAAMPPALGAVPSALTTELTEQQQQQSYFLLVQQQQQQQQQLWLQQQQQQQQQGGGGYFQGGWNPALLAPQLQLQQEQPLPPAFPAFPPPPPPPPPVSLDALLLASAQAAARGDSPLATRLDEAAVALSPRSAAALAALGAALHSASPFPRLDLAIFFYGSALRINPGDGRVLNNLGAALAAAGAPAQAAGAYRASLAALSSQSSSAVPSSTSSSSSSSSSSALPSPSASYDAIADVAANLGDLLRSSSSPVAAAAAAAPATGGGGGLPQLSSQPASSSSRAASPPAPAPAPAPPLVANSWGSFGSGLSALVASTPIFGGGGGGGGAAAAAGATGSPPLPPSSSLLPNVSPSPQPPPPHLITDARSAYLRALASVPGHVRALTGLGDLCAEHGDAAGAAEYFGRAVAAAKGAPPPPPSAAVPSSSSSSAAFSSSPHRALSGLAAALRDLGRLTEAEAAAREALPSDPCCAVALGVLTAALRARGDAAGAAAAAARVAAAAPPASSPEAFNALGNALCEARRPLEAVAAYSTCIRLQLSGVGGVGVGSAFGAAALSPPASFFSCPPPPYAAAEAAAARLAVAYSNMAAALRACGRPEEATRAFEQVALLRPSDPAAASELGASLKDAGRHDEAAAAYRRALALLKARGLPGGAALAHLVHSLACVAEWRGDFPFLLKELERETRAALAASGSKVSPPAMQPFHAMSYPFDPELARDLSVSYAEHVERTALAFVVEIEKEEEGGEGKEAAAAARANPSSSKQSYPFRHPPPALLPLLPPNNNTRLRVAFVSSDFGNHPLSHLMAGVWRRLKAGGKVEAFLFATSPGDGSDWRRRAETEAEHFVSRAEFWEDPSPVPLASAIAEVGCHVAIDLNGYTRGARGGALALRPAPVQACYLGFPGTLGAKRYIPWLITDAVTSPVEEEKACYAESLARMPHCYFVNDYRAAFGGAIVEKEGEKSNRGGAAAASASAAAAAAPATPPWRGRLRIPPPPPPVPLPPPPPTRESLGLPPRPAVVFACANQFYKLDPRTLNLWCRILNSVPNSCLWLLRFPPAGEARVRAAAVEAGLMGHGNGGNPQDRLVFTDVAPHKIHVKRAALADIFLDTPLVNAHTTACDVLWAGVPIVTLPLRRMASRVCASLVTAAGLGRELVARDEEDYVSKAVRLGLDAGGERARLRSHLLSTRETTSSLFDVDRWVRDFERLLLALWEKHARGEEPRSFELEKEEEVVGREEKEKKEKN